MVGKGSQAPRTRGGSGGTKKDGEGDRSKESSVIVDRILEETMMEIRAGPTERELLTLFKRFDGRKRNDDLRKQINKLESMIENGKGKDCLRGILRRNKKQLHQNLCRSAPSSPTGSEDEDEDEPCVEYDAGEKLKGINFGTVNADNEKVGIIQSYIENEDFLSKNC